MPSRSKVHIEAKFLPSQEVKNFWAYTTEEMPALNNCLLQIKNFSEDSKQQYELLYIFNYKESTEKELE